jgi:UDP-N-acetylmuramoylalanine--D-glutamate ligase
MDDILNLKNKKVTVMGLGLHGGGLAVVKWLVKQGAKVLVTDLRDKKTLTPTLAKIKNKSVRFVLGQHRDQDFQNTDLVIKNPGVPRHSKYLSIARQQGIPVETDMSLFFRLCPVPIIGITGTKGKSTTTSLIHHIFRQAGRQSLMGGNIRISPLHFLSRISTKTPVILEFSSWQLEDMAHLHRSPHIAVITNVLPDHLNRYASMTDYVQSKQLIIRFQNNYDIAILNRDNALTRSVGAAVNGQRYWFSLKPFKEENGAFIRHEKIIFRRNGEEKIVGKMRDIMLPGEHNIGHALAAIIVAKTQGIPHRIIKLAIRGFQGIPDRLELIRIKNTRQFYNDTTATAPDATIAALRCFPKRHIILLAGGFDKKLSYRLLAKEIKKMVAYLILFSGTASNKLLRELKKIHFNKYMVVSAMRQAVEQAWQHSQKHSIILLSPSAASFGMFLNEFDRGDQFKKTVSRIK